MASFNPGEAVLAQRQSSAAKFDASQAILAGSPSQKDKPSDPRKEFRDKLFENIRQKALSTEDFLKGIASGTQNTGAFFTSGLPQSLQIPRYDPEPTSKQGRFPIEAGKMGASLLAAILTEGASAPAMEAAGIPANFARVASGSVGGLTSAPAVDASPAEGATLGTLGAGIPEVGMTMLGKYLGRNVTPEEFESARQAIPANIKAPIGELADSPSSKNLYGLSRGIAFSGADKPYKQLYDHLNEGVKSLVSDAPSVQNPSQYVYDDLKGSYEDAKANTNKAYADLSEYADNNDVPFNRAAFDDSLDGSIKEISGKIKNKTTEKLYGDTLDSLKDFKDTPINTFTDATSIRPALNDLIKKSSKEDDKVSLRYLQKMKDGLDSSIAESSTANPNLLNLHETANNARIHQGTYEKLNRKDFSPFYKIYSKGGTPDNLIGSHIRTGTKGDDYSGLLAALTEKLSPKAKGVLAKAHMQPTEDTSLAKKISKINKLSPTQRDLMFGDKAPTANNISKVSGLYPGAKSAGFTPLTGFTGAKTLQMLGEGAGLGAGIATQSPGALAAAAAIPAFGQLTQRALRSDALKDAYMKYLQRSGSEALTKATPTGQAMRTGLLSLLGGTQNGA